jgi:lauroyl/myristoyl acyltransferase
VNEPRRSIHAKAADFWLRLLFWLGREQPWVLSLGKHIFLATAWLLARQTRQNLLANAARLRGSQSSRNDRKRLAEATLANFYDFVCDIPRSANMSQAQLLARIQNVEGETAYRALRNSGGGAIVLTAHMGSFEVGMAGLRQYEPKVHVLFRRDSQNLFEQSRTALRARLGVDEAPVDEGLGIWMRLRDALLANEVVCIQGDRVMPGQRGQPMPVLGGHILLPTGPFKLALLTGAPIVPIFSTRLPGGGINLFIEPPIYVRTNSDVETGIRAAAAVLERYLRRHPEQWLVLHRAWCEDQPAGEVVRAAH